MAGSRPCFAEALEVHVGVLDRGVGVKIIVEVAVEVVRVGFALLVFDSLPVDDVDVGAAEGDGILHPVLDHLVSQAPGQGLRVTLVGVSSRLVLAWLDKVAVAAEHPELGLLGVRRRVRVWRRCKGRTRSFIVSIEWDSMKLL